LSAKDKESEGFSYFKTAKDEVFVRSHTISSNKGFLNTSWHLC